MEKADFRKVLLKVRKEKGLTQDNVAEKCNISSRTIQRIESGEVNPRAFTIKTISESLGFNYYVASNTGYDGNNKNSLKAKLMTNTILWYLTDLFNLKTNAMKKLSILSSTALITILSLFAINSSLFAQNSSKKNSIYVQYKPDKSISRIEVRFTNVLTYDSLVHIKNTLETYNIKVNYKRIDFDDNNNLKYISCKVSTEFDGGGSMSMPIIDEGRIPSFYYDYEAHDEDDIPRFCIGGCLKME